MRALDLFCGAGGASMGLHRAGFEVVGVDIDPQPNYPFTFVQMDAMEFPISPKTDLVWASPPCQRYIRSGNVRDRGSRPDLVGPVRTKLEDAGCEYIIENVPGSPLRVDSVLCGSMFGLQVRRHRWFELSFPPPMTPPCDHSGPVAGVYGNPHGDKGAWPGMLPSTLEVWSESMGIDWMIASELSQAIPPAYSEYLARQLLAQMQGAA